MISENRVRLMTRLAMFEKTEGRRMRPAIQYNKKDYVSQKRLVAFLAGTVLYGLVFVAIAAYLFLKVYEDVDAQRIIMMLLVGGIVYVLFMFQRLYSVSKQAKKEYDRSAKRVHVLKKELKELEDLYEEEEMNRSPEGDWEKI